MTYPLLKKAPKDHDSPEFLDFLRENNKVVYDGDGWLVIENCKYHTKKRPWLTAFWKGCPGDKDELVSKMMKGRTTCNLHFWFNDIDILWCEFGNYEWLKKATSKQTIKRFHIHLIQR